MCNGDVQFKQFGNNSTLSELYTLSDTIITECNLIKKFNGNKINIFNDNISTLSILYNYLKSKNIKTVWHLRNEPYKNTSNDKTYVKLLNKVVNKLNVCEEVHIYHMKSRVTEKVTKQKYFEILTKQEKLKVLEKFKNYFNEMNDIEIDFDEAELLFNINYGLDCVSRFVHMCHKCSSIT